MPVEPSAMVTVDQSHAAAQGDIAARDINKINNYYGDNKTYDGVVGLEAKLKHAGREDTYDDAIEMKEMFVKLLHQWSLYASAQQIFVYLLARAERHFNDIILPQI